MNSLLVLVLIFSFSVLLSIKFLMKMGNVDLKVINWIIFISFYVEIVILSLFCGINQKMWNNIRLFEIMMNMSLYTGLMINIFKEDKKKIQYYGIGYLLFAVLSIATTAYLEGIHNALGLQTIAFEGLIYLVVIAFVIKKNNMTKPLFQILVGFAAIHIIINRAFSGMAVIDIVIEIIVYALFGAIVLVPLYIVIQKRMGSGTTPKESKKKPVTKHQEKKVTDNSLESIAE